MEFYLAILRFKISDLTKLVDLKPEIIISISITINILIKFQNMSKSTLAFQSRNGS